ncbi:hypothetical protein MIMGU_mgv1a021484mg [Erythranthe guttata]|uniref:F-box domain-containing protein n=1 Tax=Erythranthe guttata TaxID=4155 RepID=A0A022PQX5_ERYGU|nr:hypothetical protein MIMGU_mgv1a021484mg [Erythranthe guttata]
MDRISELPKDILQTILYFLSQKEAVQTSVLSKSWRDIWCTQEFLSTIETTLRRYCDQMMCLEEFRLSISVGYSDHISVSFLERWIPTLKNMGVKDFRLFVCSKNSGKRELVIKLPIVVFDADSLQDLHVEGFMFDQQTIGRNVVSKHLKKLHLERVIIDDMIFKKIIASCPLIETMILKSCKALRNINANNLLHLKNFTFSSYSHDDDSSSSCIGEVGIARRCILLFTCFEWVILHLSSKKHRVHDTRELRVSAEESSNGERKWKPRSIKTIVVARFGGCKLGDL